MATEAKLEKNAYDRAFSISVLEHLVDQDLKETMLAVYESLKPGGRFIITTDLFLNVIPFTDQESNPHGKNNNVKKLIEAAPFKLIYGDTSQLFGYEEFDVEIIRKNLDAFYVGRYPTLIQTFILEK